MYLTPETVFVDGTHIKANANMKKAVNKAVPKAAKIYEEKLMEEINENREEHSKRWKNTDFTIHKTGRRKRLLQTFRICI